VVWKRVYSEPVAWVEWAMVGWGVGVVWVWVGGK